MAAKPTNGSDKKEEHRRLANVVKGVHAGLRRKYKESGDFVQTWHQHCQDAGVLSEYADAMHHLAMDHWTMRPDTRIDWCRSTLLEYFTQGGLAKCMERDAKRLLLDRKALEKITEGSGEPGDPKANECAECLRKNNCKLANLNGHLIDNGHKWSKQYDVVHLPIEGKIRLLDVGSCFNPFVEFDDFLAVGIDICPAKPSVYHCDFLHLETTETLQLAGDTLDTFMSNLKSPIEKLPKDSFHVVVFSLLLEYFPARYQRWLCCQKARKLLMKNGLLVIITPDSSHQNRNAAMIKSWKTAIESLGFSRWRYVKQEHLHCMAFRKVPHPRNRDRHLVSDASPDMLYIPQDFNDVEETSGLTPTYTQADEEFFRQTVHELPLGFLEDDLECGV